MNSFYVPYWKWEDYQNGMYNPAIKCTILPKAVLSNAQVFIDSICGVFMNWPYCTIHNLTSKNFNKIAWLGQAACCYAYGCSEQTTRKAWKELSNEQRQNANRIAKISIDMYQDKINRYVEKWKDRGYDEDIPDEAPDRLNQLGRVPSYKAIALAILNNDHQMQSLGFTPKKSKYYHELKKIELSKR